MTAELDHFRTTTFYYDFATILSPTADGDETSTIHNNNKTRFYAVLTSHEMYFPSSLTKNLYDIKTNIGLQIIIIRSCNIL